MHYHLIADTIEKLDTTLQLSCIFQSHIFQSCILFLHFSVLHFASLLFWSSISQFYDTIVNDVTCLC